MKKLILIILFMFTITTFVLASDCIEDTDGEDFYTKGTLLWVGGAGVDDMCCNSEGFEHSYEGPNTHVLEHECVNGVSEDIIFNCPKGCYYGACVNDSFECVDNDGGNNYYKKGSVLDSSGFITSDSCMNTNELRESICENNGAKIITYECPNGCENGECIFDSADECLDSDGGKDIYEKGFIISIAKEEPRASRGRGNDRCTYYGKLSEKYCEDGYSKSEEFECEFGCEDGACKRTADEEPEEETEEPITDEEVDLEDESEEEIIIPSCTTGCEVDGKCFTFGFRKEGQYCSPEGTFKDYYLADESCENNFECETNVCVNNQCVGSGFIQKLMSWLKRLFS